MISPAEPSPSPNINGVLETCLYATNLTEAASFYETVIGLRRLSAVEGRHVFFRTGPGVFLLFNPERTMLPEGDVPRHGARGPGHVAFAIRGADLRAWRASLEAMGVPVEADVSWPGGGASLYLRDPAGNSVELATPAVWSIPEGEAGDGVTEQKGESGTSRRS